MVNVNVIIPMIGTLKDLVKLGIEMLLILSFSSGNATPFAVWQDEDKQKTHVFVCLQCLCMTGVLAIPIFLGDLVLLMLAMPF